MSPVYEVRENHAAQMAQHSPCRIPADLMIQSPRPTYGAVPAMRPSCVHFMRCSGMSAQPIALNGELTLTRIGAPCTRPYGLRRTDGWCDVHEETVPRRNAPGAISRPLKNVSDPSRALPCIARRISQSSGKHTLLIEVRAIYSLRGIARSLPCSRSSTSVEAAAVAPAACCSDRRGRLRSAWTLHASNQRRASAVGAVWTLASSPRPSAVLNTAAIEHVSAHRM